MKKRTADSGLDNWEDNLVIPSFDMFCLYLEIQRVFSTAKNATNIPVQPTSTPDSSLERTPKDRLDSGESDSKFRANKIRKTTTSSGIPPSDDQNIAHVKSRVMVRDKSNRNRTIREKEAKPEAITQNQVNTKDLDKKPKEEENQRFSNAGEYLNSSDSNRNTGMEIRADNSVFYAHRDVLSHYSSYFAKLFSKRSDKHRLPMTIKVYGISSQVFRMFLEFIYGINVTLNSVKDLDGLMKMADAFDIPIIKEHCLKLLDEMSFENAVQILTDKQHPPSSRLSTFLVSRICEQFSKVNNSVGFYELDISILCRILSSDSIQIATETEVLQVAMKWIGHSLNERRQYISRVISCVRFHSMTQDELFQCLEITDWLKDCFEMRNLLMEANWVITARILGRGDPFGVPASAERVCLRERRPQLKKKTSDFFCAQVFPDVRVGIVLNDSFTKENHVKKAETEHGYNPANRCGNQEHKKTNKSMEKHVISGLRID